jgi:UDP-glucose:(heptosyl)LPS alpha-1,3-glucosyltransferase
VKLALIVRTLGTHGGTERFVYGLAQWLRDAGHHIDVWCVHVEAPLPGITVRLMPLRARGRPWKLWALHRAAMTIPSDEYDRVLSFVRGGRPDIYRAGGGCHAAFRQRTSRNGPVDILEERLDRQVVAAAGRVVVNSQMAAGELATLYGMPPERARLIYNGVDLERFAPTSSHGAAIGFLGTGFSRKGLETALRAVARLPGTELVVMGRDPRPGRYVRLAEELGIGGRVRFCGAVEAPEVVLPTLAAMVLPTRYDPFANACLEAMACGVPVVTSAANGAAEVLPEPWLSVDDPSDDVAFSEVLARALLDRGLRARCRAAAEQLPAAGAYQKLNDVIEEPLP